MTKGISTRTTSLGFNVMRLHYSADPDKAHATPLPKVVRPGRIMGAPAVADVDRDGTMDLIAEFATRIAESVKPATDATLTIAAVQDDDLVARRQLLDAITGALRTAGVRLVSRTDESRRQQAALPARHRQRDLQAWAAAARHR